MIFGDVNFLLKNISISYLNKYIIEQLFRFSYFIVANYCEVNEGESKSFSILKVKHAKKEAIDSKYWIRLVSKSYHSFKTQIVNLWKENYELLLIYSKIVKCSSLNK